MAGQYHCSGAVLAVAGRDAWASQTGVLFRMAQSLYGCSFFPGLCGGYHCHYGVGTAGSLHPSFGRCHRLFENAFFLAVCVTLCLAGCCLRDDYSPCRFPFNVRKIPFLLNHAGLFVALLTATLGNADMQRLKMITQLGKTEWRAIDEGGKLTELPLAVELKEFTIHEYPPKLMLIDNETGQALPKDMPEHLLLEEKVEWGKLLDWDISIFQTIPMAASVATEDTLKFTEFHSMGAAYAVYLKAVNTASGQSKEGWVSCGSFMFPYKALRLSEQTSLVMPEREPQRFVSAVTVYTQAGDVVEDTIEVNRPLKISGWNIYQLSYDETKGRWSDVSVFELVRDPWLPAVYAGIIMMVLGAVCLFVNAPKGKEERKEETV